MTLQDLPATPNYCFAPAYDLETETQQIVIVLEGLSGHIPTSLIALNLDDAVSVCDRLNRRLGHDRDAWSAMVAASMWPKDRDRNRTLH